MTESADIQSSPALDTAEFGARILRKVRLRLIPFMALLYFVNYLDRVNVGFAALTMNRDLGFSPSVYGTGAGILFLGYFLFQIPSNIALEKFGTRAVIMPIMIAWGIVSTAMAFVTGPVSFYVLRFLLGTAEAGFFPGMILYLTYWFPGTARGRVAGLFLLAIPLSSVLGAPASTALLSVDGLGLKGWQWLFVLQGLPAIALGFLTLRMLTDRPEQADWLTDAEKNWLSGQIAAEHRAGDAVKHTKFSTAIRDVRVWVFTLMYFGVVTGLYGVTMWLPQIVKGFGGLSNFEIGLLTMIPYTFAALAMYFWGAHSDKTGERTWHVAIPALMGGIGLTASALLGGIPALDFIALAIGAIGVYATIPVFWTLPTAVLSGTAAAGGIALINAIGNTGGYFGPALVGYVLQATQSYSNALMTLAGFAFLTGILTIAMGRGKRAIA
jgi:ACS family tartrate transporter-like MFS transporter